MACLRAIAATASKLGPGTGSAISRAADPGSPAPENVSDRQATSMPWAPAVSSIDRPSARLSAGFGRDKLKGGEMASSVAIDVVAILIRRGIFPLPCPVYSQTRSAGPSPALACRPPAAGEPAARHAAGQRVRADDRDQDQSLDGDLVIGLDTEQIHAVRKHAEC